MVEELLLGELDSLAQPLDVLVLRRVALGFELLERCVEGFHDCLQHFAGQATGVEAKGRGDVAGWSFK